MTVDVFEVQFRAASITRMDSFHRKNYNAKVERKQMSKIVVLLVIVKRTAGCTENPGS